MAEERNESTAPDTRTEEEKARDLRTSKNTVTLEDAGPCKKKVVVEVPEATIKDMGDEQYRELRREGVLVGSRNNYRLTMQSRALNLFGALGAYPLFPFYRTDEASGSLQLTATEADGSTERLSAMRLL